MIRFLVLITLTAACQAQQLNCDLRQYKPADGLRAENSAAGLTVTWQGAANAQLRLVLAIQNGQPTIREMAIASTFLRATTGPVLHHRIHAVKAPSIFYFRSTC